MEGLGFPLRDVDLLDLSGTNVLSGFDDNDQEPPGVDMVIPITFGPAQGSSSTPVEMLANGSLKINQPGVYITDIVVSIGRIGAAGGESHFWIRVLVNDVQQGRAIHTLVDNASTQIPQQFQLGGNLVAGDIVRAEMYRDSIGVDKGGLYTGVSSIGWGIAPSTRLNVKRF